MPVLVEIDKAIGAHGMWKQRLRSAIDTGKSDWSVDKVRPDNLCEFGRWLYSLPPSDRTSENWKKVQALHADFHVAAAKVLALALEGRKDEASAAMKMGSDFARVSAMLTTTMMAWKNASSV